MTLEELAEELAAVYGPNPQDVGVEDGTEDDFGDLLSDAWAGLGGPDEYDDRWDRFGQIAAESTCTTYEPWLAELRVALDQGGNP